MRFRHWLAPVLAVMVLSACGLNTGEKAPPNAEVVISGQRYSCIGEIGQKVVDYLDDQLSDRQINSFINCLQDAFLMFSQMFHGEKGRDLFSPEEIRRFIQGKFLPPDRIITDELLYQFMVIKNVLVGGGVSVIRKDDLRAAIGILEKMRGEAIRLRPFVPIINPNLVTYQNPDQMDAKLAAAEAAMNKSVEVMSQIANDSQTDYSFTNLEKFLHEFRQFIKWGEHMPNSRPAAVWVKMFRAFKSVTVSPDPEIIRPHEWSKLLSSTYLWYLNFIRYESGIRNKPLLHGDGFRKFVALVDNLEDLLKQAVRAQPKRIITFEQLDRLIFALKDVHWLPKKVQPKSLSEAMQALTTKMLGSDELAILSDEGQLILGITSNTVANLAREFSEWEQVQLALQERFPEAISDRRLMRVPILNVPLRVHTQRGRWYQFIADFQKERVFFKDGVDRVFLAERGRLNELGVRNGFYNLSRMNLFRSIVGLIYKGYAYEAADRPSVASVPMNKGLSKPALEAFYKDFYALGADIGFLDKRVSTAAARTFNEAKVFIYSADGLAAGGEPSYLKFSQALEEAIFIYSAGELSNDLYKRFSIYCGTGDKPDLNGESKFDRDCVRDNLVKELVDLVQTMPYLTAYLRSLRPQESLRYSTSLLRSAFNKFSAQDPENVERSELATVAMVVHYAEALMTRYNTNADDKLSEAELDKSLPIFRGFILQTADEKMGIDLCSKRFGLDKFGLNFCLDSVADNSFKFILAKKCMPEDGEDYEKILIHSLNQRVWRALNRPVWGLELDRSDIAEVFAVIISRIAPPEDPDLKAKGSNNETVAELSPNNGQCRKIKKRSLAEDLPSWMN